MSDNQILAAEVTRDASGVLVLSGSFYVGCDGSGGVISDCTVTIPPTALTPDNEAKLAALTSSLNPQPCLDPAPQFCDPCIVTRLSIGGCGYWDSPQCSEDRSNAAQLNEVATYLDSLALAALH